MARDTKKNPKGDRGKDIILVAGAIIILAIMAWIMLNPPIKPEAPPGATSAPNVTTTTQPPKVRPTAVAGSFYPADKEQLSSMVDQYLQAAPDFPDVSGIRALVSPHAGYVYSGPVAAYGYKQLMKSRYETVIVVGPSHYVYLTGAYIPDVDYFETPLGKVPVSPKAKELAKEPGFTSKPDGLDSREHSAEVEVPFLQKVLPPFKIIPIMVGDMDPKELARTLDNYIDDDTLVVASSDLSHYHPYDDARARDNVTVSAIVSQDVDKMTSEGDACGKIPILALMEIAKEKGWRTKLFDYRNSGDTAGDKSSVVGYSSIGFYDGLDNEEQQSLLDTARQTLVRHYAGQDTTVDESKLPPKLLEEKGCFVTLNENGQLRGCIGTLVPQEKLYKCVIDNALNAALQDPRFNPVEAGELGNIKIEVSVLTVPRPLSYDGPDDLKAKLIQGVDGVILKSGMRQSTYLPVVWEQLPDKEEFLSELCLKQGSPTDCWKNAEVMTYQAQEFHQDGFR